jgi:murein DD-endopeptidase MepM/ murein hydrolase activator NlpD
MRPSLGGEGPLFRHPVTIRRRARVRRPRTAMSALAAGAVLAVLQVAGGPSEAVAAISDRRQAVEQLRQELAALDARAGEAAAAHNRALDRLHAIRGRMRTVVRELRVSRVELRSNRAALADRLVEIYVRGEPQLIDLLLGSGGVAELFGVMEVTERIAEDDSRLIAELRERGARLAELRAQLAADREAVAAEAAGAARRRAQVLALVRARRSRLAAAEAELRAALAAEQRRLAALAARKRAAPRDVSERPVVPSSPSAAPTPAPAPPAAPGGSNVFPILGATTFSDDWLASRAGGRLHEGIDLFAARGTPVVAVADGSLFNVGWNGLGGWRLWLRDGAGTGYYYAHLDAYAPAAREGAAVSRGTVLGYVGDSGDAKGTSPHVHFEIHPGGGGPIRPYPLVASWPRG